MILCTMKIRNIYKIIKKWFCIVNTCLMDEQIIERVPARAETSLHVASRTFVFYLATLIVGRHSSSKINSVNSLLFGVAL